MRVRGSRALHRTRAEAADERGAILDSLLPEVFAHSLATGRPSEFPASPISCSRLIRHLIEMTCAVTESGRLFCERSKVR